MALGHGKTRSSYPEWFVYTLILSVNRVLGHGRLVEPASRSSAWRYNFSTPRNFNDHEIYCGGFSRQWTENGGQCGPCGDPWDVPVPRPNEGGGEFGQGIVVRTYKQGAEVELGIELTANHYGHFEFRICPTTDPKKPETNECFDQFVLQRADGEGEKWVPGPGSGVVFKPVYRLPQNLTCLNCVLQWRYIAGNNWGMCADGTGKVGCGAQEEFRACADITITDDGLPDDSTSTVAPTTKATTSRTPLTGRPRPPYIPPPRRTTTTSTTSTTTANVTTEGPVQTSAVPGMAEGVDHMPHVGPYIAGLVILGALLFTLLFFICIIVYFYHGHTYVKAFIKRNGKGGQFKLPNAITSLYAPNSLAKHDDKVNQSRTDTYQAPPPVTISHSVMSISSSLQPTAPTLPISAPTVIQLPRTDSRKRAPEPPARSPTTILSSTLSDGIVVNNCIGVQRNPEEDISRTQRNPVADHSGSQRNPATDHSGAQRNPATDHSGTQRNPATDHSGAQKNPATDHSGAQRNPATDHSGAQRNPATDYSGTQRNPTVDYVVGAQRNPISDPIGVQRNQVPDYSGVQRNPVADSGGIPRNPVSISEPMNVAINGVNVEKNKHLELTPVYIPPNKFYRGDSSV